MYNKIVSPGVDHLLSENRQEMERLCKKYAVRRLKLFGSATGSEFNDNKSDLDFLVEFGPPPIGMRPGVQFFEFVDKLEEILKRPVDLLEESAIENSHLRRSVMASAVTVYAA